jgi:hypothetical protein
MISGKWVEAGLYVGEVLPEKNGHVRVEASAIRHGRIGMGALPGGPTVPLPRRVRKPAHRETVADCRGCSRDQPRSPQSTVRLLQPLPG